jgi:hypothetical protein
MKPRKMPSESALFSFARWKSWDTENRRRRPGKEKREVIVGCPWEVKPINTSIYIHR